MGNQLPILNPKTIPGKMDICPNRLKQLIYHDENPNSFYLAAPGTATNGRLEAGGAKD